MATDTGDTVTINRETLDKVLAYIHKTQPPCTTGEVVALLTAIEAARTTLKTKPKREKGCKG